MIDRVLKTKVNAAEQRRQRLREIVETTREWIWELDPRGCFTFSNSMVERLLGYTAEEIIGQNRFELMHPLDQQEMRMRWMEIEPAAQVANGLVARWVHRDGSIRWLDCEMVILRDSDGSAICYRGADRDVTLRREQEERVGRLNRVNDILARINLAIVQVGNRVALLQEVCRLAVKQGGYRFAVVYTIEPGTLSVSPSAWWGVEDDMIDPRQLAFGGDIGHDAEGPVAQAMRTGDAAIRRHLGADAAPAVLPRVWADVGVSAIAALPLIVDGTSVGVLSLQSEDPESFNAEETQILKKVGSELSFALQYLRHEDLLKHLSYFDTLTGLANRRLWCERLARRLLARDSPAGEVTTIVFDLDGLSAVNDGCGREVGDRLLQLIAERLRGVDGGHEQAAYLGAGVFAAWFDEPVPHGALPGATSLAARERIEILMEAPFTLSGRDIKVTARMGASCFPAHGNDAHTLLENAEVALRRAKHRCDSYVIYTPRMTSDAAARLALEAQLRQSVREESFELHYQPIVASDTGRITTLEALLRWRHPQRGIVPAGEFVPVLESLGLIEQMGAWALRRAAQDRARWADEGLPAVRIAVNVSAAQLRRGDFVDIVRNVLGPLEPAKVWLDLEVTETMLMHDVEASMRKLNQVRTLGVHIAIDDFGTGYSSLSRLASLPITTLKVDRSFVQGVADDPRAVAIVESILSLARSLDLNTIAEGIETERQRSLLSAMGCAELQGYLFSRPLCAADCGILLHSRRNLAQDGGRGLVEVDDRQIRGRRAKGHSDPTL